MNCVLKCYFCGVKDISAYIIFYAEDMNLSVVLILGSEKIAKNLHRTPNLVNFGLG